MSEFWILVTILVVGFILTWIFCSKMPDTDELEYKPSAVYPIARDIKMEMLEAENYRLRRTLENIRYDRMYYPIEGWDTQALRMLLERPVEVNVDVKVENNETLVCKY